MAGLEPSPAFSTDRKLYLSCPSLRLLDNIMSGRVASATTHPDGDDKSTSRWSITYNPVLSREKAVFSFLFPWIYKIPRRTLPGQASHASMQEAPPVSHSERSEYMGDAYAYIPGWLAAANCPGYEWKFRCVYPTSFSQASA